MNKTEFLDTLASELTRKNVADTPDIVEEYEQHFAFKLADGYSEEEIAARLGKPETIAAQYDTAPIERGSGKKVLTVMGLGITDFFFSILCILLYAWEIVMAVLVLVCGVAAVGLLTHMRATVFALIPTMPYFCGLLLGMAFAALAVLSVVGALCFGGFIRQLMRSFGRFHHNAIAAAAGRATLPPVAIYPPFSAKAKRRLRKVSLFAAAVFAVCFLVGFVACVISAGTVEFWHSWGWFGYGV